MGAGGFEGEDWRIASRSLPAYIVSSFGRVQNIDTGRFLAGFTDKDGYRKVGLSAGGQRKNYRVHRLVCEAFHGPPKPGMEAAHLDGNRANNRADNLAWVTHAENSKHKIAHGTSLRGNLHPKAKLTPEQVVEAWLSPEPSRELAARFEVSLGAIETVRKGRNWSSITENLPPRPTEGPRRRLGSRKPGMPPKGDCYDRSGT